MTPLSAGRCDLLPARTSTHGLRIFAFAIGLFGAASPARAGEEPDPEPEVLAPTAPAALTASGAPASAPDDAGASPWREAARVRGMTMDDQAYRERRHVLHNTWSGAVGGLRVVDAGSAAPRAYRVLLGFSAQRARDWLASDAPHGQTGMVLAVSSTPRPGLELFGTTTAWRSSDFSVDRTYFQVLGDTSIGAKASRSLAPWAAVGADGAIRVPLNTVRGLGPLVAASSVLVRANASVDLRDHALRTPLIVRVNVGYHLNNEARVLDSLEQDRYRTLPSDLDPPARVFGDEDRQRIDRVERVGMRIDRTDRAVIAIGFEAPIGVRSARSAFAPIGEWVVDAPVNRQGFGCPTTGPSPGVDGCGATDGLRGHRQSLLVGARVNPYFYGLSAFAAAEIGVVGVRPDLAFQDPLAPVRFTFGFAYAHDQLYRRKR
jgi:hypothetical protein